MFGLDDIFGGIGDAVSGILDIAKPYAPQIMGFGTAYMAQQGQEDANRQNIELARENNAFNAQQASMNRQFQAQQVDAQQGFQERMANTAYQRATQDMQAAGLNPMLAYQQGGAASPSGAAGSGSQASGQRATVENAVASGLNSGAMASRVAQELNTARIQNANMVKQGEQIDAQTQLIRAQIPRVEQETMTSATSSTKMAEETKRIREEIPLVRAQLERVYAERDNLRSVEAKNLFDLQHLKPLEEKYMNLQTKLLAYELPGARNTAEAQEGWWGKFISPYVRDVRGLSGAAGGLGLRRR